MIYPRRVVHGTSQVIYLSEFFYVALSLDAALSTHYPMTIVEDGESEFGKVLSYIDLESGQRLMNDLDNGCPKAQEFIHKLIHEDKIFNSRPQVTYVSTNSATGLDQTPAPTRAMFEKHRMGDSLTDEELDILLAYYQQFLDIKGPMNPRYELMMSDAYRLHNQLVGFKKARMEGNKKMKVRS